MNLYKFEVKWYNSTKNDYVYDYGFVVGDSFSCALKNIEYHYFNNSLMTTSLERINSDCSGVIFVDSAEIDLIKDFNDY